VDFESQNWLGHALIRGLVDLSNFAQQRFPETPSLSVAFLIRSSSFNRDQ
jgi:hypothetical protein